MITNHDNIDIPTLSEMHITEEDCNDNTDLFNNPGYKFIKRNRPNGSGGGITAFILKTA